VAPPRSGGEAVIDGTHTFRHETLEEGELAGKLVFFLRSKCIVSLSADEVDKTLRLTFWIGTDDDPMADRAETWDCDGNDSRLFAALARSVGLGYLTDTDAICEQIAGTESLATVWIDKKGYNRARTFYALGSAKLEVRRPRTVNGSGTEVPSRAAAPIRPLPSGGRGQLIEE
jgi:hypothetical protein